MPFIGLEHVEAQSGKLLGQGVASDVRSAVARFEAGDILYGRLRPYLNKVVEVAGSGCASAELIPLTPADDVSGGLLRRIIMSEQFLAFTAALDRGDRPRVSADEIGDYRIALPPAPEQRRIVAKLDALTAYLARARAELDRVPVLATKLRATALGHVDKG